MGKGPSGAEAIRSMKRRCAALVQHMTLDDIRGLRSLKARRSWMRQHFGGWSQGLEAYMQASMARRIRALQKEASLEQPNPPGEPERG